MSGHFVIPSMVVAFSLTTVFMFALRPFAISAGLVDRPGGRKSHVGDVPITGGIAMFIGIFAGIHVLVGIDSSVSSVMIASLILVAVGVTDDRFTVPAPVRFVAQISAVLIMVYGANLALYELGDPFGTGLISLGPLTLIFTMAVALTMINAYNLIDGADGLAGTLAFIALLALALVSGFGSVNGGIALTACAAIVGYLLFNFPLSWNRAVRSFMGDAGSTLLGFTVVWVALGISQGPERSISPVHCLWFASIPIYDCLTCFVRRSLARKSPFTPGRDHFHHTLLRGGLKLRPTLGLLTGLQALYASIGLLGHFAGVPDVAMFAAWSVLGLSQRFVVKTIARHWRGARIRRQRTV
jgi:UDP-GlcNAc:undecaprenyl-phosphate GlcNAc-1-phosphate transferase